MPVCSVRTQPAALVFDGQSLNLIPFGQWGTNGFPQRVAAGLGLPWENPSIGGKDWDTLQQDAATRTYIYGKFAAKTILVMNGGTSDVQLGDSGAQVYTDMSTFADGARTAGFSKVCALTITKFTGIPGGQDTQRIAANSAIMADASSKFDAKVDVANDVNLADPSNTTYYVDGLHWTSTGAAVAASLVIPAVRALL